MGIVLEVGPADGDEADEVIEAVRRALVRELEIVPHTIAACARGSVPKTTTRPRRPPR